MPVQTPALEDVARRAESSLDRVMTWVKAHRYRAYEPADGNGSVLFPLTGGRVWPMRVLQQAVLRAPFNIRPWLGVRPHESAIGRGYLAWANLLLYRRNAQPRHRTDAEACLDWLVRNRATGYEDFCWGDPYHYATRSGRRPYGEPLLIWCALIGQAFLDAYDLLGDQRDLNVADSVGRWVLKLPAEQTSTGRCLSYNAYSQSSIHNSNAMGAAFLARLGARLGSEQHLAVAQDAMRYTGARQRPDGSWFYAEDPKYHWIDNFHTGYNLSALKVYRRWSKDTSFDHQLSIGGKYFVANFFEVDGRPGTPRSAPTDRHPVCGAGDRNPGVAVGRRPVRAGAGFESDGLDPRQHAGARRLFLLSAPRVDARDDADAPLGTGNDGESACGPAREDLHP